MAKEMRHAAGYHLGSNMIIEKVEELIALIQPQPNFIHEQWSSMSLGTAMLLVIAALGLLFITDYGYMIYLHFKMVLSIYTPGGSVNNEYSLPGHFHYRSSETPIFYRKASHGYISRN